MSVTSWLPILTLAPQIGKKPKSQSTSESHNFDHILYDHAIDPAFVTPRERYEAVARSLRDLLSVRWLDTKQTHYREDPKRAFYMSMEFLIGSRRILQGSGSMGSCRHPAETLQAAGSGA
jgi:glucan phosphorylase